MAERISIAGLKKLPVAPYEEIRGLLKAGDLFFASGRYTISKMIQKMTGSAWSHVGIIFPVKSPGGALLLESVEDNGVRFVPIAKYLRDYGRSRPYNGLVITARVGEGVDKSAMDDVARFGIDELAKRYDKEEVGKIVARIMAGKGRMKRDREYICSELVYECFLRAGIEFAYDKRGFISPENIWEDERIRMGWRIL